MESEVSVPVSRRIQIASSAKHEGEHTELRRIWRKCDAMEIVINMRDLQTSITTGANPFVTCK